MLLATGLGKDYAVSKPGVPTALVVQGLKGDGEAFVRFTANASSFRPIRVAASHQFDSDFCCRRSDRRTIRI